MRLFRLQWNPKTLHLEEKINSIVNIFMKNFFIGFKNKGRKNGVEKASHSGTYL